MVEMMGSREVGGRWRAGGSSPVLLVLRAGRDSPTLTCDTVPFRPAAPGPCSGATEDSMQDPSMFAGWTYHDPVSGLVIRCVQSGVGQIACDGRPMLFLSADSPAPGGHDWTSALRSEPVRCS